MAALDRFRQVEQQYAYLRQQWASGGLTPAQYQAALQQLVIQDAQGRAWVPDASTGRWMVNAGQGWVAADPYAPAAPYPPPYNPGYAAQPQYPPPQPYAPPPQYTPPQPQPVYVYPAPQKKRGGCSCWQIGGCGCLALVAALVLVAAGGFYAYSNHLITLQSVLSLVGMGPAQIEVDNFRDEAITVSIVQTDAAQDSSPYQAGGQIGSLDVRSFTIPNAAHYQVTFTLSSDGSSLGACTLNLRGGSHIQFVTLPGGAIVNDLKYPPATGSDLNVSTSTVCR